jgi:hypothetical protein
MMGPMKIFVAIVRPVFHLAIRTGSQMELARQTAMITGLGEKFGHEYLVRRY